MGHNTSTKLKKQPLKSKWLNGDIWFWNHELQNLKNNLALWSLALTINV